MRGERAIIDIVRAHGDGDGSDDKDHGEDEVLAKQRHDKRRRRDDLGEHEEEDGKREEDVDTEGNLLSAVARQVEDEQCDAGVRYERPDQVDGVEEELTPQSHVKGPFREELRRTCVVVQTLARRHCHEVPLDVRIEAVHIDAALQCRELVR